MDTDKHDSFFGHGGYSFPLFGGLIEQCIISSTQGMVNMQLTLVPSLFMSMIPTCFSAERCFEVTDLCIPSSSASSQTQ
jgi:hypothetical protein